MGKTKLFINCFRNPTSTCATKNWRKHNSGKQLHPWNHPAFRCQTQYGECDSTFEPEPAGKTKQIGTFNTFILQTPMEELRPQLKLVEPYLVETDGRSLNREWLEFELTLYNILCPATRRRWRNDKKFWSRQSLATEYIWRSRSWRWHLAEQLTSTRRTILKDWENKCKIATK